MSTSANHIYNHLLPSPPKPTPQSFLNKNSSPNESIIQSSKHSKNSVLCQRSVPQRRAKKKKEKEEEKKRKKKEGRSFATDSFGDRFARCPQFPKADIRFQRSICRDGLKVDTAGHSISSSARITTDCESVRPNAFAAFMPITISNLVGSSTGRSAGFEPLKIILT